jgi:hypothetical protein
MTYQSLETSVESGRPVEVYTFTIGGSVYRRTSTEGGVTIGVEDFDPVALERGKLEDDLERHDTEFEIVMPASDPLCQLFLNVPPGQSVAVLVRRYHVTDTPTPEVRTIFDGELQTVSYRKGVKEAVLVCLPKLAAGNHTVPAFTFQGPCNHVHYDEDTCKVDPTDPAFRASSYSVSAQVGRVLTVPGLSVDFAAGWFIGGLVEATGAGDFRMVLDQVGDDLYLLLPFVTQPTLVTVLAGCAHDTSADGCPKFANGENYGGFPFVPKKNPYETGL